MLDEDDTAMLHALGRHASAHRLDDFLAQGARCGWCAHPIRLRGYVLRADDGRLAFSSHGFPDNVVLKACGSRSELRCPSCATLYRGDARHLVRAGLEGGKGVDASIAAHPAVFVTLTAPGFGLVHRQSTQACHSGNRHAHCPHGRPLTCEIRHGRDDEVVGTPLCSRCYDYTGAVLHNAHSAELWRRSTIYVQRQLAAALGLSRAECAKAFRLEHAKVAEFQRRGLVHFHAVVRADGHDGSAPPLDAEALARACLAAVRSVEIIHPRGAARWGSEVDVQVLERESAEGSRVPSYVAKYATKEPAMHPGLLGRILSESDLKSRLLPPHLFNMVATAWALGAQRELVELGLRRHAHHLGYSGHFLTKSRGYSTTFSALRDARAAWHRQQDGASDESETTTRLNAVGRGWANGGEALFAAAQARQRAEDKKEADWAWHTRSE